MWSTTLNAFEKSANVAIVSFTSLHNLDDAIFEVQTSNTVVVKLMTFSVARDLLIKYAVSVNVFYHLAWY